MTDIEIALACVDLNEQIAAIELEIAGLEQQLYFPADEAAAAATRQAIAELQARAADLGERQKAIADQLTADPDPVDVGAALAERSA